jgi:uncharacterized iron-regulated protein
MASVEIRIAGAWYVPQASKVLQSDELLPSVADRTIVLLGESHASREPHCWRQHTLAGLHALRSDVAVGFEMFPRAAQSALGDRPQGTADGAGFLAASRRAAVWGYHPEL